MRHDTTRRQPAYQTLPQHADGGAFKSILTQRVYPWRKDNSGANREAALRELRGDDGYWLQQYQARGGEVTPQLLSMGPRPEAAQRPYQQKPLPPKDFAAAVEACEQQLSMATPHEKKTLERRLERMKVAKVEYEQKKQAEQAEQARRDSPQVQTCLRVGETCVAVLEKDATVDQALCDRARVNLANLKRHYDTEAFAAEDAEIMAAYDAHRAERYNQAKASDEAFQRARSLHAQAQSQKPE